jgi:hypothetical protein
MAVDYKEMLRNLEDRGFVRHYPIFEHHVFPNGMLSNRKEAHAAWYFCMCMVGLLRELDAGSAEYEGERDHTDMANNILRSVAMLYQLDSPSELLRHLPECELEAARIEIGWDPRINAAANADYRKQDN